MTSLRVLLVLVATATSLTVAGSASGRDCGGTYDTHCGVSADQPHGDFHGLIAISGYPSVFATAARSGTQAGCGDCIWTLVVACPTADPKDPNRDIDCNQANKSPLCKRGVLERLFLSDAAVSFEPEGTLCLRKGNTVIPIGDDAQADVARYLKDVTPPDLEVATKPKGATLAGLTTYFSAAPPATLKPHPFGNGAITETITIAPKHSSWTWGDGDATGWIVSTARQTHRYLHGGTVHGGVTTQWGATYTITFAGATYGPYDATGQLTKRQTFTLPVDTSSPVLVSHG